MLQIHTFDQRAGGNVIYKALAHPLAAEAIGRLYAGLTGPVALYDPEGLADPLLALYPGLPGLESVFVHDVTAMGQPRAGHTARPLTELPDSGARTVLIAAFDAARIAARIAPLLPPGAALRTPGRGKATPCPADQSGPLPRQAELRDELRPVPRCRRPVHPAGLRQLLVRLRRRRHPPVAAAVRRRRCGAGHLGAGRSCRPRRLLHRQPGGARPFQPAAIRRPAVHSRGRRRRPRRGEIRVGHLCLRQRRQPVLHARRQRLAVRPLCRPARPARGRAGGAVAAEQPCRADPAPARSRWTAWAPNAR